MARNLNPWQRKMIVHMITSRNRLTTSQMAKLAKYSERSITNKRKNMRLFGSLNSPTIPPGPPSSITPVMLDALCDHLAEIPGLYIEEMSNFLLPLRTNFRTVRSSRISANRIEFEPWFRGFESMADSIRQNSRISSRFANQCLVFG